MKYLEYKVRVRVCVFVCVSSGAGQKKVTSDVPHTSSDTAATALRDAPTHAPHQMGSVARIFCSLRAGLQAVALAAGLKE